MSSLAILGGVELLHDAGLAAGGVSSVEGALLGGLVEGGTLGGAEVEEARLKGREERLAASDAFEGVGVVTTSGASVGQ